MPGSHSAAAQTRPNHKFLARRQGCSSLPVDALVAIWYGRWWIIIFCIDVFGVGTDVSIGDGMNASSAVVCKSVGISIVFVARVYLVTRLLLTAVSDTRTLWVATSRAVALGALLGRLLLFGRISVVVVICVDGWSLLHPATPTPATASGTSSSSPARTSRAAAAPGSASAAGCCSSCRRTLAMRGWNDLRHWW
eukprot:620433-Pleurochrysis_carterae.AAC.2